MGGCSDQSNVSCPLFPQQASATGGDLNAPWEYGPTAYDERHRVTLAGVESDVNMKHSTLESVLKQLTVEGALTLREPRQLDDDAVLTLLLDERLGYAELVDALPEDLHGAVHRVLGLGGVHLGAVHLEHEVHAALEVQAQVDGLLAEVGQLLGGDAGDLLSGAVVIVGVELEGREQAAGGGIDGEDPTGRHPPAGGRVRIRGLGASRCGQLGTGQRSELGQCLLSGQGIPAQLCRGGLRECRR